MIPAKEVVLTAKCNRTDEKLITALNEPGDFGQSVVRKKISFWRWIKDVHNADMLYFYHPNDPKPAWSL